jgi:magnesium chelatase subunit D
VTAGRADPAEIISPWTLAKQAAKIFAVDPIGTGICLRARAGPQRERWLEMLSELMPDQPIRKIPPSIGDDRLLGGLDLAATLSGGRPIAERGILSDADGGVILIPSAERASASLAARIAMVHERGEIRLERDGLVHHFPARFGLILIDEGLDADESPPAALLDRVAFRCDLSAVRCADIGKTLSSSAGEISRARERLPRIEADDAAVEALCAGGIALGIASVRAPLLALRAAKAAAALEGRDTVSEADLFIAAQLVLGWRAQYLPDAEMEDSQPEPAPPEAEVEADEEPEAKDLNDAALNELVLEAVKAALPPDLLTKLLAGGQTGGRGGIGGKAGALQKSGKRGRRIGVMRGDPRSGARLDLVATLKEAAPWQRIREHGSPSAAKLQIRPSDFRTIRLAERRETVTIFAVDASSSLALNRLGEAKGAVELLLADCYIRRDQVAMIAFRGNRAEILLPPTRSLVRAKRSLSHLPGGGGTPLADGIDAASALAQASLRRGQTPLIVMLTDGRSNIARGGQPGRSAAHQDALSSARLFRESRFQSLLIDTAPRPEPRAQQLAEAMGAIYLALPHIDAGLISKAVKSARQGAGR